MASCMPHGVPWIVVVVAFAACSHGLKKSAATSATSEFGIGGPIACLPLPQAIECIGFDNCLGTCLP